MGLDDAEAIYRYALKQIDLPVAGIHASALPALITLVNRFLSRIGLTPHPSLTGSGTGDVSAWASHTDHDPSRSDAFTGMDGHDGALTVDPAYRSIFSQRDPQSASEAKKRYAPHSVLSGIAVPKKL